MTLFTRTMLIAGIAVGTAFASVANLQAGCGGGGYRPHYPSYSRPSCHRPVYQPQPAYQPPAYQPAPSYGQPIQQPGYQQPQQGFEQFQQPVQQPQQGFQQPAQQPTQQSQQGLQQPAPQTQPVASTAPQPQAPTANDAQMTALQALAGMTGQSQAPTAPQPQTPGITGTWTARLGNGAVVQLTLQADGSFNWSATNKTGQVSSFQGSYTMAGGSLTLVRSEDNRKLAGTMTQTGGNAFNFKLAGANDNGLDFVRS